MVHRDIEDEEEGGVAEESPRAKLTSLEKALAEARAQTEANLAGWQRAQADFANYRRRAEQEKEETAKFGCVALLQSVLPVLDDFERAIAALPQGSAEEAWGAGVKLIERKLRTTLEAQGLSMIKALGEPFDPRFHEAVRQGKGPEGTVVEEAQKGYKFFDRVIRPARVVVGTGEPAAEADGSAEPSAEAGG
jgi:molecular chaperone GrpE